MLKITTHIERLLLTHDCVIVPKFGGFVLQTVPSQHKEEEHLFRPARKEIVFNTTLQHNDGLLSEAYMQAYQVNYRKAQLMLEEDVQMLLLNLQKQGKVSFGKVGSFALGSEGQIVYWPGETELFGVSSYGLPAFHFPLLQPQRAEGEETKQLSDKRRKEMLYIPVNRKLLRIVAASAAAIAMFLLISTPVKEVNQAAYRASFIPSEMVSYRPAAEMPTAEPAEASALEAEPVAAPQPVAEVKAEKKKLPVAAPVQKPINKSYHIVIASFPNEAQADEYIAGVDRSICRNVSKVARDGKYRIYADKFDNRQQAESYMSNLRQHNNYKDAWLFISR